MSNPQTTTFDERFKHVWTLFEEDKLSEATAAASELLREPHLGPFHQAGMRLIMKMASSTHAIHSQEAFRLRTDKGAGRMTDAEKAEMERLTQHAHKVADSWLNREVQKKLDNGWTMQQVQELQKKAWDKFVKGEKKPGVVCEDDEPLPGTVKHSSKDS